MKEINQSASKSFVGHKLRYDSLNQAIKIARGHEARESDVQRLVDLKARAKQDYFADVDHIIGLMSTKEGSNMVVLCDGWYGIAYVNEKKQLDVKFELAKDLYLIERDLSVQNHFTRADLETMLPAYLDEVALEMYKNTLYTKALEFVHDYTSVDIKQAIDLEVVEQPITIKPSAHASKRWVQRRVGITAELQAEEYRRANLKEVDEAIVRGFNSSVKIWEGTDGVSYHFDEDNLVYVVGNNTVITLYEEDFGFDKGINRTIVLKQVEVIKQSYDNLMEIEKRHEGVVSQAERDVAILDAEIRELQLRVSHLTAKKVTLAATREESNRAIMVERERFSNQFNKLFKKWEV